MELIDLEHRKNKWFTTRDILKQKLTEEDQLIKDTKELISNLNSTIALLQYIVEETSKENELQVTNLVTIALRETFPDKELSLVLEHKNYRGQPGVIFKLKDEKTGVEDDPFDSFGGGPASLVGLALQIISIVRNKKMDRILILDEPLLQVSEGYHHEAALFLQKICKPKPHGLGFKVLAVTHQHQSSIYQIADRKYKAIEDNGSLTLEKEK